MIDFDALWRLKDSLVQPQTKQTRFSATYSHTDQNGIPWVKVAGSEELSPVTGSLSATMEQGQTVELETRDGTLYVAGNSSDPSQGSNAARAAQRVLNEGIRAAKVAAAMADNVAKQAKRVADAIDQHFWTDGSGVHVTEAEQEDFEASPTGRNILMNAYGILLREGENWLSSFTEGATAFYDGLGNEAANIVAQFGADGARIGKLGAAHSVIDANGQRFYGSDGTTQLANIGYGDSNAQSGTSAQPYFTFGERETTTTQYSDRNTYRLGQHVIYNGDEYICIHAVTTAEVWNPSHWALAIGGYSTAGGRYSTASGFASHAQNYYATAMGSYSSAGGFYTKATGTASHVEGSDSIASGYGAHAEGAATEASGNDSHAQNSHTIAASDSQTAIGKYNDNDPDNAFEVGNGTADDARSNALAVGWDGTIETARDRDTTTWAAVLSSKSSDINITGFKLAQRGQVVSLWIRFQRTTATSAGAAITVGTLSTAYRPLVEAAAPATTGAGDAYVLESGSVMYRPQSQLAANTNAYVRVTYLVA